VLSASSCWFGGGAISLLQPDEAADSIQSTAGGDRRQFVPSIDDSSVQRLEPIPLSVDGPQAVSHLRAQFKGAAQCRYMRIE
jgi:hypothetical protein